ncbi:Uncharacterized membrane protein YesL [Fictibacillus solisalsi]|uniref:Uncharacterized membrane protein YesL n=1 Tax=Fictibacillus solisalsi TaxID=459525 RepID=A0A1G9YB92_9BACL|nr:DUF624 domain-containing protein [Fictibacillus solisalsi]SDN06352.1 Uncharacterized membrane protein YesL [Fictibacillus solisalsi]
MKPGLGGMTRLFLLNAVWLICSLPIITIFPATAAMFGVIRDWRLQKGFPLVSRYWSHFRGNLKAGLIIGWALALWILALLLNVHIILQFGMVLRWMLLPVTVALLIAAVFVLLLSFPFMVHYELGLKSIVKNTLYFVVIQPQAAFFCLLLFSLSAWLILTLPFLVFIVISPTTYLMYRVCDHSFRKIENMKRTTGKMSSMFGQ